MLGFKRRRCCPGDGCLLICTAHSPACWPQLSTVLCGPMSPVIRNTCSISNPFGLLSPSGRPKYILIFFIIYCTTNPQITIDPIHNRFKNFLPDHHFILIFQPMEIKWTITKIHCYDRSPSNPHYYEQVTDFGNPGKSELTFVNQ